VKGTSLTSVDLTFGGAYADEISTEITALAIRATKEPRAPPTPESTKDWFEKDGEPLTVISRAEEAGVLTATDAEQLRALDAQVMALIAVDDFDGKELGTKSAAPKRKKSAMRKRKKSAAPKPKTSAA